MAFTERAPNLRDAQKLATRTALSNAAIDLFTTRGFDETRVEDIAEAAGVTSRTFFLHYSSKEDAAFPDHADRIVGLVAALDLTDTHVDPLTTVAVHIEAGVRNVVSSPMRAQRYPLLNQIPELRERDLIGDMDYEAAFGDFLFERWSAGPYRRRRAPSSLHFAARHTSTTALGIARAALRTWADDRAFDPVRAAKSQLAVLS